MATQVKRVRRKRRRDRHKKFYQGRVAIYSAAIVLALIVGFLFIKYAPQAYNTWRESGLLKAATQMMQKQDYDGATRAAQQMLRMHPESLAAFQILANATERQNKPETVAWRSQITRVLPHDLDAQLNLASAALRFGQMDTVRRALEDVSPEDRDRAAYHVVAGWLARAEGNDVDVEQHFAAAVKQEPANDLYQFNFAVLQIRSPDSEKNSVARETLERLRKVPGFRAGALRALLTDAVQNDDLERADGLAQDLQMSQQVTFADYLLCLGFYRKLDEKKFNALLEKVKPVAAREPADIGLLMDWMNKNGLAAEVLKWNDKLPPEVATVPPPAAAIADAFTEMKNWSRLKRWTRGGAWGESEFLRLAYQAFAARQARQSGAEAEFDSLWHSAERAATDHPDREGILARLAMKWGLTSEAKGLWKRVAKYPPMRREALDALFRIHRTANDLPELLQVAKQMHDNSPRETPLTSSYARLALLLAPNTEEAQHLAKEAYEAAPTDPNCAVTYAFALYNSGRTAEGLEVLKKLPDEDLADPHNAVYAALLFLDNNEPETAKRFVDAAQKGPLYPEEKKLLDEALVKASAPPPLATPRSIVPVPAAAPSGLDLAIPPPALVPATMIASPTPLPTVEAPGATPVIHPLLRDRP